MNKIKVTKSKLLGILKENLEKHVQDYDKAVIEWKEQVAVHLNGKVSEVEAMATIPKDFCIHSGTDVFTDVPRSYAKEYETVIGMLEMDETTDQIREIGAETKPEDALIDLNQGEYMQYVKDEWSWKHDFVSNTLKYRG